MRKIIFVLLLATVSGSLLAQKDTTDNYVKRFQTIPPIKLNIVPDSAVFTNENLKKNMPFILMFFSPECEHCQRETKELLAYKQELKGIQILMVSALPFKEIKDFYETYGLSAMPNVHLGQDLNIKLGLIYKVRTFPSMYVYDKRGQLAKAFVGNISVPAILEAVK